MQIETGDFTLWLQHGEPFNLVWHLDKTDDNRTWTPLPTAGYTLLQQIRLDERESAQLLLDVAGDGYVTIDNGGIVTWAIPKEIVLTVPVGTYFHDFAIVDPSGTPQYLVRGRVVVGGRTSVQEG